MTYKEANQWAKERSAQTTISGAVVTLEVGTARAAKSATTPEVDLPVLVAELQRQLAAPA